MIHIIGANGYIGTELCKFYENKNVDFLCYSNIKDERCSYLDLRDASYDIKLEKGDIVVLLSAISSPDICQNNYELAYSINVTGTSKFIDYCIQQGSNVIFLSSDTVNGATEGGCNDEYSEVHPFGNYAQMKYEIEKKYSNNKHFKTLRLSYVLSDHDKFISYLKNCVEKNEVAEVFDGLYRSVVTLDTVLEAIYSLSINFNFNDYYLCNVSGNQCLSRKDLAHWFKENVPKLEYKVVETPEAIIKGRPNKIYTKSLFLEKLLGHKVPNLINN